MDNRYIPNTDEVRGAWIALTHADESFDRWLAEVKREVWDEAVNQVIATVRCDSEDVTWVNKNPYRQEAHE